MFKHRQTDIFQKMDSALTQNSAQKKKWNVLIVRNDGLGDLIVTLPLAASLKKQLGVRNVSVTFLVNHHFAMFCKQVKQVDDVIADEGFFLKRHKKLFSKNTRKQKQEQLLQQVKEKNFDIVLFVYGEAATARLIGKSKIPVRVGQLRRSFFYNFNYFFTGSRRKSGLAEWQLNLQYLSSLKLQPLYTKPTLSVPKNILERVKKYIKKNTVVVHPYKRNATAMVWPLDNFYYVIKKLQRKNNVIVIGDTQDETFLNDTFSSLDRVVILTHLDLLELSALFLQAKFFIGNPSGPLHLAALCNLPHIGFFPKEKSTNSDRWQTLPQEQENTLPKPKNAKRAETANNKKNIQMLLSPPIEQDCPKCIKEHCEFFPCTNKISVDTVKEILLSYNIKME